MTNRTRPILKLLILFAWLIVPPTLAQPPPIPPPIVAKPVPPPIVAPAPVVAKPIAPPSQPSPLPSKIVASAPPKRFKTAAISWPKKKSCVAWAAQAKIFWFKSEYPVGLNCYIQVSVKEVFTSKIVHIEVPIIKFDSGEPKRDSDVFHMLGGDKQPMLTFDSDEIEETVWNDLMSGKTTKVHGFLSMGGVQHNVEFTLNVYGKGEEAELEGVLKTHFTAFRLTPPRVAWGVIADVKDILDLHVILQAKDVSGLSQPTP